jgi:transposase
MTVLPQPPYSPDLAPAEFFLFPTLKSTLKGRRFESTEAIKTNSLAHLCSIPKTAFQECFRTMKKRWQQCIQSRGEYFEGDKAEQLQGKTGKFLRNIFGNFPDRPRTLV